MMESFLAEIGQVIPSDRIYTDELRTLGWGTDASFYRQIPKVVIRSDGEEEISKIVKACKKHKVPFTFRAAGTSLSGQSCTDSVLIVYRSRQALGRFYTLAGWREHKTAARYRGRQGKRDSEALRPCVSPRPCQYRKCDGGRHRL